MEMPGDQADRDQYLTFSVAGGEYGVEILRVKEIIEYEAPTAVPSAPPWIRGVINLRGTVVPVISLAARFGLAEPEPTGRSCIVIVESDGEGGRSESGLLVESVREVLALEEESVRPVPSFGTPVDEEFLLAVAEVDGRFVLLVEVDRVLDAEFDVEPEPA